MRLWMTIAAEEFEAITQFYTQAFERSPDIYHSDRYAEFQCPQLCLGIFKPKPDQVPQFAPSPSSPLSFCIAVENLETAIEKFLRIGATIPGPAIAASHGREIYVFDPLQNRIILYEPQSQ